MKLKRLERIVEKQFLAVDNNEAVARRIATVWDQLTQLRDELGDIADIADRDNRAGIVDKCRAAASIVAQAQGKISGLRN